MRRSRSPQAAVIGTTCIVLTLLSWTSVPLFLKHFADYIDVSTSNGWRYGFSALLWAPVLLIGAWRRKLPKGLFTAALVPAAFNSVAQVAFVTAQYKIDPGLLTFSLRSQMLFVAVGVYVLFPSERKVVLSKGYLIGLIMLLAGTAGAILLGTDPVRGGSAVGVLLGIASGMLGASYGMAVRKFMAEYNSVVAFAAISLYTAAAMVGVMLIWGDGGGTAALDMPALQFGLLLLSSVLGIAVGHVLYYMSIARLGVAISAGVLQLHPFTVSVASYYVFTEVLTAKQWISGAIAVSGALLMLSVQKRLGERKGRTEIEEEKIAIAEGEVPA